MVVVLGTAVAAGVALGYMLQRSRLCFHAALAQAFTGRPALFRAWSLGVLLAAVGFAVLLLLPGTDGLNRGLAFRPVGNLLGGAMIGVGMVVAHTCITGLFFKLGAGMVGALVGLSGWGVGELLAREVEVPGPTLLDGGSGATLPGLLGVPPLVVAATLLGAFLLLSRHWSADEPEEPWTWSWRPAGIGLGLAVTIAWAMAAAADVSFGASSVGVVSSIVDGETDTWHLVLLVALVLGSLVAARTAGGWWLRGETGRRVAGLFAGGLLLGAGAWVAGGCNLGHGLSGMAQLNVSSIVVVAAMAVAVLLTRRVLAGAAGRPEGVAPVGSGDDAGHARR